MSRAMQMAGPGLGQGMNVNARPDQDTRRSMANITDVDAGPSGPQKGPLMWTGDGYKAAGELLVAFTVWGEPKPKGRPRFGGGHVYTDAKTKAAETAVLDAFEFEAPLWEPTVETLRVEIDFHRRTSRPADIDNLAKTVLDALNKRAFADDKQISELTLRRFYGAGDKARTEIRLYILGD